VPVQAGEPGRDRPLIILRHDQTGHLARAEQPGPLVLVTDDSHLPPKLVSAHLNIPEETLAKFPRGAQGIVPLP
jgi:hypothetical protein